MSPRRKVQPGEEPLLVPEAATPRRAPRWGPTFRRPPRPGALALSSALAAVLTAAAVAVCTVMLIHNISQQQAVQRDRDVLRYVRSFMTQFTSIDPFHANDYVENVIDQATGDFAKQYHDQSNEILLHIAREERTTGTVLDAGVERWNDDGSASVMVATAVSFKSPDGKQVNADTDRWVATAKQEGNAWKISNLVQVI